MSTPIGSRPVPPPDHSGFFDKLKEGGHNFKKLSLFEKVVTVTATIFASIPTIFIGGFFTFIACSNYFADRHVKKVDLAGSTSDSKAIQKAEKTDRKAQETFNGKSLRASAGDLLVKEAEKLKSRINSLTNQVKELDLDSSSAIHKIFMLREGFEREKQLYGALDSGGKLASLGDEVQEGLKGLEQLLVEKEEQLLYRAGAKDSGSLKGSQLKTGTEGTVSFPKEVERVQLALYELDQKIDGLQKMQKDKFIAIASINEALLKEHQAVADVVARLKDTRPDLAGQLELQLASVESKMQAETEGFRSELEHATSTVMSQLDGAKKVQAFAALDAKIDEMVFDTYKDLESVYTVFTEITEKMKMLQEILSYSDLDSTIKGSMSDQMEELKLIEIKLKEKVKANIHFVKLSLEEGLEKAQGGVSGGEKTLATVVAVADAFKNELEGLDSAEKLELEGKVASAKTSLSSLTPKGICNIGNSCYMNSTVQALLGVPAFKEKIMSAKWPGITAIEAQVKNRAVNENELDLVPTLSGLFKEWEAVDSSAPPKELLEAALSKLKNPNQVKIVTSAFKRYFVARRLQSALQNFSIALDKSKDPYDMAPYAYALRKAIFETGIYGSSAHSLTKQHDASQLLELINDQLGNHFTYQTIRSVPGENIKKVKTDPMGALQIPIETKPNDAPIKFQEYCDRVFETTHIDDPDNALKVEEGSKTNFYAKYDEAIQMGGPPPSHLVIQLKRFEWFGEGGGKIGTLVELPEDHIVDLSKAFKEAKIDNVRYKVVAAVHHGGGLGGGHYKAFVEKAGQWHTANDSQVYPPGNIDYELADSYLYILERVS